MATNIHKFDFDLNRLNLADEIRRHDIFLVSKSTCPFCIKLKNLLAEKKISYTFIDIDTEASVNKHPMSAVQNNLFHMTGQKTVPMVFAYGTLLGGFSDIEQAEKDKKLDKLLSCCKEVKSIQEDETENKYEYDLAVIGGGSGGLACVKKAAEYGKRTVIFDYVQPSPMGSTWGLGGTCVNVGCIPKKLMHNAAIVGETIKTAENFGWENESKTTHDWTKLVGNVQTHIKSLNFAYKGVMRANKTKYINAYADMVDKHTIEAVDKNGKKFVVTSKFIVYAVGERPLYPENCPGAKEFGITSDDLFALKTPPKKTLVIGASYVALECAGFLKGLNYDVTVMVRSIFLRGFDQQMANMIGDYMENVTQVKFIKKAVPLSLEKDESTNKIRVKFSQTKTVDDNLQATVEGCEEFDTVVFAIGRESTLNKSNLSKMMNVELNSKNHAVGLNNSEMTELSNVFVIGDVLANKPQLTPMAIKAGSLLAQRLFSQDVFERCDYSNVATTIFTPLEYGCVGLSEEDAIQKYGKDNINVYHDYVNHLESALDHEVDRTNFYCKVISVSSLNEKIVGMHVCAPNAGEIIQGYALGVKLGATTTDLFRTVGIHPTASESFTTLSKTKASKKELVAGGC